MLRSSIFFPRVSDHPKAFKQGRVSIRAEFQKITLITKGGHIHQGDTVKTGDHQGELNDSGEDVVLTQAKAVAVGVKSKSVMALNKLIQLGS